VRTTGRRRGFLLRWISFSQGSSPFYYDVLFFAFVLKGRFKWEGIKPLAYFVLSVSLAHGSLAALVQLLYFVIWGGIGALLLFALPLGACVWAFRHSVRAAKFTCHNGLDLAKPSLVKAGVVVVAIFVPSIILVG